MSGARSLRSRKNAERRGRYSEHIAAWSYRIKGFRVLAKRYRTPFGEIDLVLRRRSLLIFAEVKARATFEEALYALRPQQQQRLSRAASIYLRDHPKHNISSVRFDLIAVRPWRWPRQIVDACRAVTGHAIPEVMGQRRAGDPPELIADARRAAEILDWGPRYTEVEDIVETAWRWHRTHPQGYRALETALPGFRPRVCH